MTRSTLSRLSALSVCLLLGVSVARAASDPATVFAPQHGIGSLAETGSVAVPTTGPTAEPDSDENETVMVAAVTKNKLVNKPAKPGPTNPSPSGGCGTVIKCR